MLKALDYSLRIMKMKESDSVPFLRQSACSLLPRIPRHNWMSSLKTVCSTPALLSTHYHTPDSG